MLSEVFNQCAKQNRFIKLVLVFALLLASMHVALHDLGTGNGLNEHEECQVCRINHVPIAALAVFAIPEPVRLLLYLLPISESEYQLLALFRTQRARAPPVLI